MDTGAPWTCAACGAGNAGYRRRCPDCRAARPTGSEVPAAAPPVDEDVDVDVAAGLDVDIPLPLLARRRARDGSRWPAALLTVVVLALALYGAITYVAGLR